MSLFDNHPKIAWGTSYAKALTRRNAEAYLEDLEAQIEANDYIKGTQICLKKGRIEGVKPERRRHEVLPVAVAVRVDKERSLVYNIKHRTSTVPVPTEMALATVRFINEGHNDKPGTT